MHPKTLGGKVVYFVGCPYSTCCYGSDRVERHLMGKKRNWKERDAKLFNSRQIRLFNFITKIYHRNEPMPPCPICWR